MDRLEKLAKIPIIKSILKNTFLGDDIIKFYDSVCTYIQAVEKTYIVVNRQNLPDYIVHIIQSEFKDNLRMANEYYY